MEFKIARTGQERPKFTLGRVVVTPGILSSITAEEILQGLRRHAQGDWGELDNEDLAANNVALENGGRLFSAYDSTQNVRFWIITECDRSSTTLLLPEDY